MTTSTLEVRPDHGGKDAEDFVKELSNSIYKYCTRNSIPVNLEPATGTNKSYLLKISINQSKMKWLEGVHTVTRIPRGSSSRHTSSATVVVLDRQDDKQAEVVVKDSDIRVDHYRGTGSGGQRKNKVSTAVRLFHKPTGIIITRETGRSQIDNLESAKAQLEEDLKSISRKQRKNYLDNQREVLNNKERSFTHNYQRGEVVDHSTGKRWDLKIWNSGKMRV